MCLWRQTEAALKISTPHTPISLTSSDQNFHTVIQYVSYNPSDTLAAQAQKQKTC